MSNLKRIAFTVDGRVQGVFYRSFTVTNAKQLGLTGHVQNASDGTVCGEAQGGKDRLEEFLERLRQGPPSARVDNVKTSDREEQESENDFVQK